MIASTVFAVECEACGAPNRPESKFCLSCGTPLARPPVIGTPVAGTPDAGSAGTPDAGSAATNVPDPVADPGDADNPWLAVEEAPGEASGSPSAVVPPPAPSASPQPSVPPGAAAPAPTPPIPQTGTPAAPDDPHGFASAAMRLSPASRQAGFPALAVASLCLADAERVQVLVQGVIGGLWGVALLTDERVLLVTPRLWTPDRITLALEPGLTVKGWAEGHFASLTFHEGDAVYAVEQIADTILAVEFANRLRAEVDKRRTE